MEHSLESVRWFKRMLHFAEWFSLPSGSFLPSGFRCRMGFTLPNDFLCQMVNGTSGYLLPLSINQHTWTLLIKFHVYECLMNCLIGKGALDSNPWFFPPYGPMHWISWNPKRYSHRLNRTPEDSGSLQGATGRGLGQRQSPESGVQITKCVAKSEIHLNRFVYKSL